MRRVEAEKILSTIIKSVQIGKLAQPIWEDWPALRLVAVRLCWYLSPYLETESGNILEECLTNAIHAYHDHDADGPVRAKLFLNRIGDVSSTLASLRISVKKGTGEWVIWPCDTPLMAWMTELGSSTVQIRQRQPMDAPQQIALCLMSSVCTMRDLQFAGIGISR